MFTGQVGFDFQFDFKNIKQRRSYHLVIFDHLEMFLLKTCHCYVQIIIYSKYQTMWTLCQILQAL